MEKKYCNICGEVFTFQLTSPLRGKHESFLFLCDGCKDKEAAAVLEDPSLPTKHLPGGPGKVEILRKRFGQGLELCREGDYESED